MDHVGHARHHLDDELRLLEHRLLEMAAMAEGMVSEAVESLVHLDVERAMKVVERDDDIDILDLEIEAQCLRLLALQQPAATDFRMIGTALKMITDVERIGDLAVDVAKAGMKIDKELGDPRIIDVPRIAVVCRSMIRQSIEAFVRKDLSLVEEVVRKDDEVDQLYRDLRDQIHRHMRNSADAVVSDSWLLLAIHHLERIADHAVNIAERVSFMVTGQAVTLASSHGPGTQSE